MKTCDLINEKPAIPAGETQCLYGNIVYVAVERETDAQVWGSVAIYVVFALLVGILVYKNLELDK